MSFTASAGAPEIGKSPARWGQIPISSFYCSGVSNSCSPALAGFGDATKG
jgi:hypothetical protein